jgi:hypothetical protein
MLNTRRDPYPGGSVRTMLCHSNLVCNIFNNILGADHKVPIRLPFIDLPLPADV